MWLQPGVGGHAALEVLIPKDALEGGERGGGATRSLALESCIETLTLALRTR